MRIIASGTDIRYQWRKNGVNRPGDTNAVLTIGNAVLADSGSYDCIVSNVCQSVTSAAKKLTITKAPTGPRLTLSQSVIDLGCVDRGTSQNKTITGLLKNEGETDLIVTAMNIAGAQASLYSIVGAKSFTLTPGQSQDITVKFTAGETLTNTADITIKSNSTTGDKVLALIGKSCFERIDTTAFSFGKLSVGLKSKDTTIRVCNTGSKDASITGMTIIGSDKFSIKNSPVTPFVIAIGECKNINISFSADQSGVYTAGLKITSALGSYTIPLNIEIATSIAEDDFSSLQIMPNPTQQQFRLTGLRTAGIESISIYSMMGQKLQSISGPFTDDVIECTIDGHPSGLYVVRLESKDGRIFTRHIMKQE
ncbi:MAG: choice-of-anchor D domain-containing protein, partial [Candidatus Kapaibacteriota bacterium]